MRHLIISGLVVFLVAAATPVAAQDQGPRFSGEPEWTLEQACKALEDLRYDPKLQGLYDKCKALESSNWSASFTLSVWPKYFGANRAVFHDGPVVQPDFYIEGPHGWALDLWASVGLDNQFVSFGKHDGGNFDDEIDGTLIKACAIAGFDCQIAVAYYAINAAPSDVWNPFVEVSRKTEVGRMTLTPYMKAEYYTPARGREPLKGFITRLGVRSSIPLGGRWSASPWGAVFHDTGAFGSDSGWLLEGGVAVSYQDTDGFAISLPVKCGHPISSLDDGRHSQCVVGLSLGF